MKKPPAYIALLRGINVTGRNMIPMPGLRNLCTGLGWEDVQTYIQSGNLVFMAGAGSKELESALEKAIESRFGLSIPVIVRPARAWSGYIRSNPFPEASDKEPNLVMMGLSKAPPKAGAAEALCARAAGGERVAQTGEVLWIHFPGGVARSKLSPAVLDRSAGSPVTLRNWRTVLKLGELSGG